MGPRILAIAAVTGLLLAPACFVDDRGDRGSESGGTTVSPVGTGSDPGTTTGTTTTGPGTTGEATGTTTLEPGTTSTGSSTGAAETTGSLCPAADAFPDTGTDECRACLAQHCCDPVRACAGDPACPPAWSCVVQEPCIDAWQACPGYAEQGAAIGAISACRDANCAGICPPPPCAAEDAACKANPACQAVNACVQASCTAPCPPEDPNCTLACWAMCIDQNPTGGDPWSALIQCYDAQCA